LAAIAHREGGSAWPAVGVRVDFERAHHTRHTDGGRPCIGSTAARVVIPFQWLRARRTPLGHLAPRNRVEPGGTPRRDVDVDWIRRKTVAQAELRGSIEQFIGQSEETTRGSEEVVLPPQEIVCLAHQGVDEVILDLQVRVPNAECGVVEIRGFGRAPVPDASPGDPPPLLMLG